MMLGRYLEGVASIVIVLVPLGAAARVWRKRLLPGWVGAVARLAEIVTVVAVVVCVSELLGSVHLFWFAAVVPVLAVIGAVGWYVGARHPVSGDGPAAPAIPDSAIRRASPRGATLAAVVAVGVVAADWGNRTVDALHHGMTNTDTLWYHMPFAARFVQQGSITQLHYVDSEAATVFFPASSELIHALGLMFMGSDLLSPMVNMGWGAIALLAAWCVGRPYGVAPVTLTGVAVLLATPGLVATQPGGAYDDIVGLALLLSCAALLVTADRVGGSTRLPGQAVAALAAGLALGTKFTFIAPVGALTIGVWVLARRGRRLPEGALWLLLVAVTGGFWYVRNLVIVGNPLPNLHIKLGPLALPYTVVGTPTATVAHYLLNGQAWRQYLLPGLRLSFGPAWWAVLGLAGAGLVLAAVTGPGRMGRMLGWVGLAAVGAFLITPQYLAILGAPIFFVDNVRYGDPGVVYGLVLLPLVPLLRGTRRSWGVLGAYLGVLGVTQLDGTIWPTDVLAKRFGYPIGGIDALIGLLFGAVVLGIGLLVVLLWRSRPRWRPSTLSVVAVCAAVVIAGYGLQQFYLRNRYVNANPLAVAAWAQHLSNSRIAVAGDFAQLQYEFYGKGSTNWVAYIGQPEPNHGWAPVSSCPNWRRYLNEGHYDYVVTTTGLVASRRAIIADPTTYTRWTSADPAARLIRSEIEAVRNQHIYIGYFVFRLHGRLDPATCPRPRPGPAPAALS